MLTTDLALRFDPIYAPISKRFYENPNELADAFARAWFKLTHRDMGPRSRYLGPLVPDEALIWQDPIPAVDHELVGNREIAELKAAVLASGLSIARLVATAWASASTFRGTDKRGGANGARLRLAPQKDWEVNEPAELAKTLAALEKIQKDFNDARTDKRTGVSGGPDRPRRSAAAWSKRRRTPDTTSRCPSRRGAPTPLRRRPTLSPSRCWSPPPTASATIRREGDPRPAEDLLVDRAHLLTLSAPEMTVLVGGLRVLGTQLPRFEFWVLHPSA